MGKNAEETRERILAAALDEFAAYGIAGARVDRIAQMSCSNKGLIYVYFESKEKLFVVVLERELQRIYAEITFTPDDLPGYAGKLFDFGTSNPKLLRLFAWHRLEGTAPELAGRGASYDIKLKAITKAQVEGSPATQFTPEFLMTLLSSISNAWTVTNPFSRVIDPDFQAHMPKYREQVVRLFTLLFQKPD